MFKKITVKSAEGISDITEHNGSYSDNTLFNKLKTAADRLCLPLPDSYEGSFVIGTKGQGRWIEVEDLDQTLKEVRKEVVKKAAPVKVGKPKAKAKK